MHFNLTRKLWTVLAPIMVLIAPAQVSADQFEKVFDTTFGTELRSPRSFSEPYSTPIEQRIALLADGEKGRIGVAAIDLATGQDISVLGNQRFPMASTSKIAIAATFLDGVDRGRWSLDDQYALRIPVRSTPFSTKIAPVRHGTMMSARDLIEIMITRSSNSATDAMLAAVGGPKAVNDWVRRAGIEDFQLDRDIATLVRDDGEFDPSAYIDLRDSATPRAMVALLTGLYQGRWLEPESRDVIIGAMERCRTGTRRIPARLPATVQVAHKTGSLNNTSSDIGIIQAPDGRAIAVAIYVTGQGSKLAREAKIAEIARAIYDGYTSQPAQNWVKARY